MKTAVTFLIFLLIPFFGITQSIEKSSIDSGGASALVGDIQVLYTLGEVNLQELAGGDIQVSEGFINPTREAASADLFITKWVVTTGQTITIPTRGTGYNYDVDWSYDALDGFIAESMNQTGDATSPVLAAGEHIVAITGDFPSIYFNQTGDKNKITEIVQWGTNPWVSMRRAFAGCPNLNIVNPAAGEPDLSSVTDMSRMFYNASSFNADISNWDVSNVENMNSMFFFARIFNQDISGWDTGNVTNMTRMFYEADLFDQNLGDWDIGNVTSMQNMFFNVTLSTNNYDNTLIGWSTDDSGIANDGIDDIPTNILFNGGFSRYCAGETARNLLTAALPTPTGYGWTIDDAGIDCGGGDPLFITKWLVTAGQTITIPTRGTGYNYDVDWSYDALDGFNAESMNQTGNSTSPVLTAGEHIVAITGDFPRIYFNQTGDKNKIIEIVQWGSNPWISMNRAFAGCANLNIVNPAAGEPDLSSVTDMYRMFYNASSFNADISNWDVSTVENMNSMFFFARIFNQDISGWDTGNVTNMTRMFYEADLFDQNLGDWDIGNVTSMENMFFNVTLSTNNYDNTLIGWSTDSSGVAGDGIDDIPTNILFSGGDSSYCAGETARNLLTAALPTPGGYGWTITDAGLDCGTTLFITKWVVLDGETITIPTLDTGYNYNVDWSYDALDGFNAESMNQTGDATSPVLAAGEHIVAINGDFPHIFFNSSADSKKITEIVQWGTNPWTSMRHAFEGCSNLNITNPMAGVPNLASVTTMKRMFFNATSFNAPIGNWDVSNVTDVKAMFRNAYAFDQDLGSWDIGNMNDMEIMFLNTGLSIENYDNTLIGWATDSSGNPSDGIDDIPTNITFNAGSSRYCAGETARNLLTAALPAPTGYGWIIDDGGIDCGGGDSLFITKWEVLAGQTITIPTFGGGYDYDVDWSYDAIDGFNAESMNISGDATSPVLTAGEHIVAITGDFPRIFFERSPERNKITEIVQWGTNPWQSMKGAFAGCANLNIVNPAAGAPNLSLVTNMSEMFSHAISFDGDVSNWDVSNIEDMGTMFFYARIFNQDISGWDTGKVINMSRMFYRADSFNQNLGGWDIGNVTSMENMFFNVTLSTNNYDNTLIGWSTDSSGVAGDGIDDIPTNILFSGGDSEYCAGEAARNLLTADLPTPTGYGWTISDGGLGCPPFLLGVNDSNLDLVSLYPNPTQNIVTIVSPQLILTSATVYDIQGRKVSEVNFVNKSNYEIDLSDLEAAVYLINITTDSGTLNKRVIKKN